MCMTSHGKRNERKKTVKFILLLLEMLKKYGNSDTLRSLIRLIFEDYLSMGMSEFVFSEHER